MSGELVVRVACPKCRGAGAREGEPWCVHCDGDGLIGRTPTPADLVAHVVALPAEEARALLVALLRARPDEGPKPWKDGDPRGHCSHCSSCARLYRTKDIDAHQDVCTLRLLQQAVRAASLGVTP
jgi:hypothetical protein